MAVKYNTSLVTDSLVLCVDSANPRSYPGSGNDVFDLTGLNDTLTGYNDIVITENAFDFTALYSDGLSLPNNNFAGLEDFTMEAFFSVAGNHVHYNAAFISSGNWNSDHWAFSINSNNTGIVTRKPYVSVNYSFSLNEWYHAVFLREGTTLSVYINNENIYTATNNTNIPLVSNATNTAIGRETYAGGYFNINGKISNVKIYDRALTDSEIQKNYEALRGRYGI